MKNDLMGDPEENPLCCAIGTCRRLLMLRFIFFKYLSFIEFLLFLYID